MQVPEIPAAQVCFRNVRGLFQQCATGSRDSCAAQRPQTAQKLRSQTAQNWRPQYGQNCGSYSLYARYKKLTEMYVLLIPID